MWCEGNPFEDGFKRGTQCRDCMLIGVIEYPYHCEFEVLISHLLAVRTTTMFETTCMILEHSMLAAV